MFAVSQTFWFIGHLSHPYPRVAYAYLPGQKTTDNSAGRVRKGILYKIRTAINLPSKHGVVGSSPTPSTNGHDG